MNNNLVEELSKEFKEKLVFRRQTYSLINKEVKLKLDFVPKLKPKQSGFIPTPMSLNPLAKVHKIKTPTNFREDMEHSKKVFNFNYNSAEVKENILLNESTDGQSYPSHIFHGEEDDIEEEISDSDSSKEEKKEQNCPFSKSKTVKTTQESDLEEEEVGSRKTNSILKFLENKRRNTVHVDHHIKQH